MARGEQKMVAVRRDVPALKVPDGTPVTLHRDTFVNITQDLGGNFTVTANGQMLRIDGTDADAIGQAPMELHFEAPAADGGVRQADLWEALRTIYDPEIPVNIVDLGLVYGCDVIQRDGHNVVQVRMTLTSPVCGMGPVLVGDVEKRLSMVPNVDRVEVSLEFDPPWNRDMMSDEARLELGLY